MKLNLFILSTVTMINVSIGADPVDLGTAGNFVILAKTGISTVPSSVITGDIAVSPIAASAITGFNLAMDTSNEFSTDSQTQLRGTAKAPDYTAPTGSELTTAVSDMETAYNVAAARPTTVSNLKEGVIGGETLGPGV
jgi:hypothetical protein